MVLQCTGMCKCTSSWAPAQTWVVEIVLQCTGVCNCRSSWAPVHAWVGGMALQCTGVCKFISSWAPVHAWVWEWPYNAQGCASAWAAELVFSSLGARSWSWIAMSCDPSVVAFLKSPLGYFPSSCAFSHAHQQLGRIPTSPFASNHVVFAGIFVTAVWVGVK